MFNFSLPNFKFFISVSQRVAQRSPPKLASSVQFSHSIMSNSLWPHRLQHTRLPCPSPTPIAYSNSYPLSQWCHSIISCSVIPFSSYLQSFPASGSFQMSKFFASGGESVRVLASASVLPMNIQDWFPLGWTGWISLLSKGLSRVFSSTTVQKHQFFGTQPSLWSNSQKLQLWLKDLCWQRILGQPSPRLNNIPSFTWQNKHH